MKLDNKNIWLTGEAIDAGNNLDEIMIGQVGDHRQSTIYYKKGIPEIDVYFKEKSYIKKGYVSTIISFENAIGIFFGKYDREILEDFGVCFINRDKILRYEELDNDTLEVVKREERKHIAKGMAKRSFGALGGLISLGTDKLMVSANTHIVQGSIYKLFFLDEKNKERCVEMYSAKEFEHSSQLFLNTYFKNKISEEAKIKKNEDDSCFIATACYKDSFAPELIVFRDFRDSFLRKYLLGIFFIKVYYRLSPFLYKQLYNSPKISNLIKKFLDRIYILIK